MLLSAHMASVLFLVWFNIFVLTIQASIGVTSMNSYLGHLILCTLGYNYSTVPRIHGSKQTKSEGIGQGEGC